MAIAHWNIGPGELKIALILERYLVNISTINLKLKSYLAVSISDISVEWNLSNKVMYANQLTISELHN